MAKQNSLTQSQIDEICLAYDDCRNQLEVARRTKHSLATVSKYLIASGRGCGQGHNQKIKITDQQILDGIAEGLTRQQIADRHGVHVENLARRMRKLGVHAVYQKKTVYKCTEKSKTADDWHWVPTGHKYISKYLGDRYEFISYRRGRYKIKCTKCGFVTEKAKSSIRKNPCNCENCTKLSKERENLYMTLLAIKESKTPKVCAECGNVFYSVYPSAKYCSLSCKKQTRGGSYRERARKYGVYYDPKVTRMKVVKRDRCICQICNKPCDPEDHSWGTIGPLFPTIDHIIPLAKGGTHTFDNCQCAHAICNSYKRDIITV